MLFSETELQQKRSTVTSEKQRVSDASATIAQRDRLVSTLQEEKKEQALAYDRKQRDVDQLRGARKIIVRNLVPNIWFAEENNLYAQKLSDSQNREVQTQNELSELQSKSAPMHLDVDRLKQINPIKNRQREGLSLDALDWGFRFAQRHHDDLQQQWEPLL